MNITTNDPANKILALCPFYISANSKGSGWTVVLCRLSDELAFWLE